MTGPRILSTNKVRNMSSYSPYCTIMNYEEYLEYLLDIRRDFIKYKTTKIPRCRYFIGNPVGRLIEQLDFYLKTPPNKLRPRNWYDVGWILGDYFGKKACKMVFDNKLTRDDLL